MTVYGITRASTRKQQASPTVQAELIRQHCATVQLPEPTILDEPLGTSGRSTDFRHRPQGRWLLLHAQPGDVLVVTKLDRLGRTASVGKGDRSNLCEAPSGPFRQIGPVPFSHGVCG